MARQMATKNISEKILLPLSSTENERGGGTIDLRVMAWVVDGKEGRPTLDKREMYLDESGNKRSGKAKGLTVNDILLILKNLSHIAQHMKINVDDMNAAVDGGWPETKGEQPYLKPGEMF